MEENFWEKHIKQRTRKLEEEDRVREERIEKAKREEKSLELTRAIKNYIEKYATNS